LESAALKVDAFRAATGVLTVAVAAVLLWLVDRWPPHEDEALALFVGRGSPRDVLHTVIAERGGAPLHFLLAWAVVHTGGGLTALRLVSVAFAVASVPLMAVLGARLADRATGVLAAAFASASWVFLFHGIFGRMYSLFLFTSLLSFLALLARRYVLWGLALLLVLASHPYAVLVVGAEALFVVLCARDRRAVRDTLVTALAEHALGSGIARYTAIAEMGWLQQILAFGWRCRPLGLPVTIAGKMLGALSIEIDADTPRLLAEAGIVPLPASDGARAAA